MRIGDIVRQIRAVLPNYTGLFGNVVSISSINASGGLATIVTSSAHGLSSGQAVTLSGISSKTGIDSFSQNGLNFTFTTSIDHDLTQGWPEHSSITLGGFTDNDWNANFSLGSSVNRRTFVITSSNAAPVLNGNEYLLENRIDGINGVYSVSVVDSTTFTISGDFEDGEYIVGGGRVTTNPRVASVIDIDRAIEQYTRQEINDLWMFVEPMDVDVSKDRSTFSDATVTVAKGNDIRTRMIDGFSLYIVVPTTQEIAAQDAVDLCRHDLLLPIMRTLYGFYVDTGVSNAADFKTTLNAHGVAAYDKAYLVYRYEFQVVIDLTDDDQVLPQNTRAFRDIDYTQNVGGDDTTDMTISALNLDADPL